MSIPAQHTGFVVPSVDLASHVLEHAELSGHRPALVDGVTGDALSYLQLADRVRRLAGGLARGGFGPGQVLALMAPNCPDFAVGFLAAVHAGGAVTTINPNYTADEVRHQLRDSGATVALVGRGSMPLFRAACTGSAVQRVACLGEGNGDEPGLDDLLDEPMVRPCPVDPATTVAALPYSSGTTGLSKGVMLTHRNLVANIVQTAPRLAFEPGEVVVAALPLFHIYGMNTLMNPALRAGVTIVTMPRFELDGFLRLCARHRTRRCFVVPPIALQLAKAPEVAVHDLSSLRLIISGAAPLSAELAQACAHRLGCTVTQGYGMTELSPVSHFSGAAPTPQGSVGSAVDGTQVRIVEPDTGETLPPGGEGELWIRGPQVMQGYWRNAHATAATITTDGWLRTGDIGRVDADGHLYIVDRLKELVKFKGFQVAPAELEAVLLAHPDVADVAVVGEPDPAAGEVPVAFVVARAGSQVTLETLRQYMALRLATYKLLHALHLVPAIPKSPSGKILRRVLRQQLVERAEAGETSCGAVGAQA